MLDHVLLGKIGLDEILISRHYELAYLQFLFELQNSAYLLQTQDLSPHFL